MRVALFAYGAVGTRILDLLRERGHEVVGLWTHKPNPGEAADWFTPPAEVAGAARIPVFTVPSYQRLEPVDIGILESLKPDLILSAWFRSILPPAMLRLCPAYNLHASLLPRYRGRCPLNWALINGETRTGVTLHEMVPKVDCGPIVYQTTMRIGDNTTIVDLVRESETAAVTLVRWLCHDLEAGRTPPAEPQTDEGASYFGGRTPADGLFTWDWPARRIHNLVRALAPPWPNAHFIHPSFVSPVMVESTRVRDANTLTPGQGFWLGPDFCVGTADQAIQIVSWFDLETGRSRPGADLAQYWNRTHWLYETAKSEPSGIMEV